MGVLPLFVYHFCKKGTLKKKVVNTKTFAVAVWKSLKNQYSIIWLHLKCQKRKENNQTMKTLKLLPILIALFCTAVSGFSQVGINTTSPLSTLDINGNLSVKVVNLTGSGAATLINDGVYISVNPQATDQEFRLPSAVTYPGRMYYIRNINNTYTAKITSAGGMLFPKNSTTGSTEIYMYEGNLRTITVVSDGSNWTYIN